ncbi:hypothetical protein [Shouchella clausii]|uniref:hypothetical protein n=1 Tax=Shouchella clausii TaxID=79880 RepID=UPI000BA5745C|nr:hypothetical protein [Shouchella clausii]PAD92928.1 hypothetical protein CHH52_07125 [Shouchella clausii]
MRNFSELYFGFIEVGERQGEIIEAIHERERFTDAFRLDPKIKQVGIYAISFDGKFIEYLAKGIKSGRVATYVDRVNFSDFLDVNIPIEKLKKQIPQLNVRLKSGSSVVRIPPVSTKAVYNLIEIYESRFTGWFNEVSSNKKSYFDSIGQEERDDSFKLALQMANFDLKSGMIEGKTTGNLPSFLAEIRNVILTEDEMINHDFSIFGDWNKCKSEIVGMAYFEKGNENLFIWNINRKPLESVLGVDLLYYVEEYNSFVMVQYKRMSRENDKWVYRANDKAYQKELVNMKAFEDASPREETNDGDPNQFRLNSCPFYFKLCKSTLERSKVPDVIPGLYIPLKYWEDIISHPTFVKGVRGGIAVGYHNAGRWLTKVDFTNLVQKGWIGSKQLKSSVISDLIQASMNGDRAVTLAAKFKKYETRLFNKGE